MNVNIQPKNYTDNRKFTVAEFNEILSFLNSLPGANQIALKDELPSLDEVNDLIQAIALELSTKQEQEPGKGLSTNDFTDFLLTKLNGLSNFDDSALRDLIDAKVTQEAGKGLSSNDFTNALLNKLNGLQNYDDTSISNDINSVANGLQNKVDKEVNKGLSTNDFTTPEKTKLAGLSNYNDTAVRGLIDGKVDKVSGKVLSDNNYTTVEKSKLSGLNFWYGTQAAYDALPSSKLTDGVTYHIS